MLTKKPIIAAIDGYAVGGGLELSLWCDLRIVEENAIMGVFNRKFGIPLIDGGSVRLTKLIGLSRALDLILTGRPITGREAYQLGLANQVVAIGSVLGQALCMASWISRFPQECLQIDRRSAYYSAFEAKSMEDALQFEYNHAKHILRPAYKNGK